ncbi:hypothetical protein C0984_19440, partial [Clostridioides difficile]
WIPCSVVQWITIECSGFHAAWGNGSRINAVDSMQCGQVDPDGMPLILCSMTECSQFHAACCNGTQCNEVDCMQHD